MQLFGRFALYFVLYDAYLLPIALNAWRESSLHLMLRMLCLKFFLPLQYLCRTNGIVFVWRRLSSRQINAMELFSTMSIFHRFTKEWKRPRFNLLIMFAFFSLFLPFSLSLFLSFFFSFSLCMLRFLFLRVYLHIKSIFTTSTFHSGCFDSFHLYIEWSEGMSLCFMQ